MLALLRRLAALPREDRGGTAVDFAIAGSLTILLAAMIVDFGLTLFAQAALDNATRVASRLIMTGQVQLAGGSPAPFAAQLCADVGSLIPCASLQYSVQAQNSFAALAPATLTGSSKKLPSTAFNPGTAGQDVLVQVAYFRVPLIPGLAKFMGSSGGLLLLSTLAFENEPYQ